MTFVFYYHSTLHSVDTVADGANIKAFARHCPFCTLPRNRLGPLLYYYHIFDQTLCPALALHSGTWHVQRPGCALRPLRHM